VRVLFISIILLFISGCMETPELYPSKETTAKKQIKSNKTEAQEAQDKYLALQEQRSNE